MAKPDPAVITAIKTLPRTELEKIILKYVSKDRIFHDYIFVNYCDTTSAEDEILTNAKADIDAIMCKRHKGYSDELKMANALQECNKRIDALSKVCKNKKPELDLIIYVLEYPFNDSQLRFGTCFTNYDYRFALLLRKAIKILNTKLHEDYKIDYADTIHKFIRKIKSSAHYFDFVNELPDEI